MNQPVADLVLHALALAGERRRPVRPTAAPRRSPGPAGSSRAGAARCRARPGSASNSPARMTSCATSLRERRRRRRERLPGMLEMLREVVRGAPGQLAERTWRRGPAPPARAGPAVDREAEGEEVRSVSSRRSPEVAARGGGAEGSPSARYVARGAAQRLLRHASGICSALAISWIRSCWSGPGSSRVTPGRRGAARSRPSGEQPARLERALDRKRANGTAAPSSARSPRRPRAARRRPGPSPAAAARRGASSRAGVPRPAARTRLPGATASRPAASASWQNSSVGASRPSARTWRRSARSP